MVSLANVPIKKLSSATDIINNHLSKSVNHVGRTLFYTGLPSMEGFKNVFNLVESYIDHYRETIAEEIRIHNGSNAFTFRIMGTRFNQ